MLVVGGPDVGNWDYYNEATQTEENQAIVNSVKACMDACDDYFLKEKGVIAMLRS